MNDIGEKMNLLPDCEADVTLAINDDVESARLLAHLWKAAGLAATWPAASETVCRLLRCSGWDISPKLLNRWAELGIVDATKHDGEWTFGPAAILAACMRCDAMRRWIPLHPNQIFKATAVEVAEWQARQAGRTAFDDIDQFTIFEIITLLSRISDVGQREAFRMAALTKLHQMGVTEL